MLVGSCREQSGQDTPGAEAAPVSRGTAVPLSSTRTRFTVWTNNVDSFLLQT